MKRSFNIDYTILKHATIEFHRNCGFEYRSVPPVAVVAVHLHNVFKNVEIEIFGHVLGLELQVSGSVSHCDLGAQ